MENRQKTIRFLSLLLTMFWLSPLWAVSCPPSSSPVKVTARFTKASPIVNNRASQRRLARKSGQRGYHAQTIGLTESGLSVQASTSFSIKSSNRSDRSCVILNTIYLEYGFGKTSVLIDRRYRPGSCEYAAIYKHEAEHVRIMNSKGSSYRPWVARQVAKKIQSITPILTSRPNRAQRKLTARIKKIASVLIKQMNENLSAAHAVIDTPENYKRTQAQCRGW